MVHHRPQSSTRWQSLPPGRTPAPTVTPARVTSVGAPADANAGAGSLLQIQLFKARPGATSSRRRAQCAGIDTQETIPPDGRQGQASG